MYLWPGNETRMYLWSGNETRMYKDNVPMPCGTLVISLVPRPLPPRRSLGTRLTGDLHEPHSWSLLVQNEIGEVKMRLGLVCKIITSLFLCV